MISSEDIRRIRDLATGILESTCEVIEQADHCALMTVSGTTSTPSSDFEHAKKGRFRTIVHNAGCIANWIDTYKNERTPEFVESIEIASPGTEDVLDISHDWCVVVGENFLAWLFHRVKAVDAIPAGRNDSWRKADFWFKIRDLILDLPADPVDAVFCCFRTNLPAAWPDSAEDYGDLRKKIRSEAAAILNRMQGKTVQLAGITRRNEPSDQGSFDTNPQIEPEGDIDRYEVGKLAYEHRNADDPPTWPTLIPLLNEHFGTEFTKATVYRCMEEYCGEIGEPVPKQSAGARKKKPGKRNR